MIKTKTRQFNISSKGANNGSYKSDVTISLPDLHFNEKDITNVLFSVDHCEVCNSYYIINENNNDIVINNINIVFNLVITMLIILLQVYYQLFQVVL